MNAFYTLTSLGMVVLLGAATALLLVSRKKTGDWWLALFLGSLGLNTVWAIASPILAGLDGLGTQLDIGNMVTRIVLFFGYTALLAFVLIRRRSQPEKT